MKYINQNDYDHIIYPVCTGTPEEIRDPDYNCATFADCGCGLAAAIMLADRLLIEPRFGIKESLQLAYACNANHIPGTDYTRYAPALAEKLNLKYVPSNDCEQLLHCLSTGGAAILHASGDREGYTGVFTHGGHFITAISIEEDGRIAILDPSLTETKFNEEGRAGKVEVKGRICLASVDTVMNDCFQYSPKFHLFWRA